MRPLVMTGWSRRYTFAMWYRLMLGYCEPFMARKRANGTCSAGEGTGSVRVV